jgi:tetratricopeptide (TPR) repeat protein
MPPDGKNMLTPDEVRDQLKRVLESKFAKSEVHRRIFIFLVDNALAKNDIRSADIAAFAYPLDTNGVEKARVAVSFIRKLVTSYAEDHPDDRVIIDFPETGRGPMAANYTPIFRAGNGFDPSEVHREYLHRMRHAFPRGITEVREELYDYGMFKLGHWAPLLRPEDLPYLMALAECTLAEYLLTDNTYRVSELEHIALLARELNPADWRTEVIHVLYHLSIRNIKHVEVHFQSALKLNSSEVRSYGWYHAFLFAMGRGAEAFKLATAAFDKTPDDPLANAVYGLWLFGLGELDDAWIRLSRASRLEETCGLATIAQFLHRIAFPDYWQLEVTDFEMLERVQSSNYRWMYPGLVRSVSRGLPDAVRDDFESKYRNKMRSAMEEQQEAGTFELIYPFLNFQKAIEQVSNGNDEAAIDILESAWVKGNPLLMWLHMMPNLELLKKYDRFQSLLARRLDPPPKGFPFPPNAI